MAPREVSPVKAEPQKPTKSKGDSTQAEFVEKEIIKWEENGWKWDQAKVEAMYDRIDTNKDGIASGVEKKAYWATVEKEKAANR